MKVLILIVIALAMYFFIKNRSDSTKQNEEPIHETCLVGSQEPIEYKRYESLDDWKEDTVVLWHGNPRRIEFTYEKFDGAKSRRAVDVDRIIQDGAGRIYLQGHCQLRNENRTFQIDRITTKILDKSTRYEVFDWLDTKFNI